MTGTEILEVTCLGCLSHDIHNIWSSQWKDRISLV